MYPAWLVQFLPEGWSAGFITIQNIPDATQRHHWQTEPETNVYGTPACFWRAVKSHRRLGTDMTSTPWHDSNVSMPLAFSRSEFTSLPGLHLPAHEFEVSLDSIHRDGKRINLIEALAVLRHHRREPLGQYLPKP